jgi:hypothetical protein
MVKRLRQSRNKGKPSSTPIEDKTGVHHYVYPGESGADDDLDSIDNQISLFEGGLRGMLGSLDETVHTQFKETSPEAKVMLVGTLIDQFGRELFSLHVKRLHLGASPTRTPSSRD